MKICELSGARGKKLSESDEERWMTSEANERPFRSEAEIGSTLGVFFFPRNFWYFWLQKYGTRNVGFFLRQNDGDNGNKETIAHQKVNDILHIPLARGLRAG